MWSWGGRKDYEDMSPKERSQRIRVYLALVIVLSHSMLVVLAVFERLRFTQQSKYDILSTALNSELWAVLHLLSACGVVLALYLQRGQVTALGAATGVMSAWAFLSLLWGLSTPTPVSLAGPALGGGIATMSYLLTISWARTQAVNRED